jgi:hypothetical protein
VIGKKFILKFKKEYYNNAVRNAVVWCNVTLFFSNSKSLLFLHYYHMSQLAEKIAKLREFGLGVKSDTELHQLLRRTGFDIDGAINQFFEDEVISFTNYLSQHADLWSL